MAPSRLILASSSPRRKELLQQAGYVFQIDPPPESAECGVCSRESPADYVARLAWQKAREVAPRHPEGLILACDTVAVCRGRILGKPMHLEHARDMLTWLRGQEHYVYSGLCLWERPSNRQAVEVVRSRLWMEPIADADLEEYLHSGLWQGKAGAFGYQDRLDWLRLEEGSESNVVGLPLEKLQEMLQEFYRNEGAI